MRFGMGLGKFVTWRDDRYVPRLSDSTSWRARQALHPIRTTRVQGRRHSVDWDISTLLFPEINANPEHKRLNLYTRELYCFFVVRHVGTSTATRTTRAGNKSASITCINSFWNDVNDNVDKCRPNSYDLWIPEEYITVQATTCAHYQNGGHVDQGRMCSFTHRPKPVFFHFKRWQYSDK